MMKNKDKKDIRQAKEQTCDTCAFRKGNHSECMTCIRYSNWVEG
jgi:hypothetical protein